MVGIVISSLPPFIVEIKKPSWKLAHPDEVLADVGDAGGGQDLQPRDKEGRRSWGRVAMSRTTLELTRWSISGAPSPGGSKTHAEIPAPLRW